jgi:hypothetical protein
VVVGTEDVGDAEAVDAAALDFLPILHLPAQWHASAPGQPPSPSPAVQIEFRSRAVSIEPPTAQRPAGHTSRFA